MRILKLRTITWKAASQKTLKTVPPFRSERHSQIHFQDRVIHKNDRLISHKVHQRHTVQVQFSSVQLLSMPDSVTP